MPAEKGRAAGAAGNASRDVPIACRILALMGERERLFACHPERLAGVIRATGFRCARCGTCCTRGVNGHVFLLDRDVAAVRAIDAGACEPAPGPEFCDQNGTLYVSGYALRARDDRPNSCWFLEGNRCRIYPRRPSVCRIYPFMLRRSMEGPGPSGWQTFARRGQHGSAGHDLPWDECLTFTREVLEYENGFLTRQIAFLETIRDHFAGNGLVQDPALLAKRTRLLLSGRRVHIKVFHEGALEDWQPAEFCVDPGRHFSSEHG